jgi:uncharacterized SAM-binding protein YcdF (DUF218 family)
VAVRRVVRIVAATVVVLVVYLGVTAVQVLAASGTAQPDPADAIVVLGAAQYDGRPSPALRTRLDHAAALYEGGLADQVWLTGGKQPGDRTTEASTSDLYLQRNGVPPHARRLEDQGENTYQSLAAVSRYLRRDGGQSVILVSDRWHSYRLAATAREVGLRPQVSPAGDVSASGGAMRRVVRETFAVALGRVIGYRRLANLSDDFAPITL